MKTEKVELAIIEANRFIQRAKEYLKAKKIKHSHTYENGETVYFSNPSGKESGATKRASLDLTRALAELRKP